MPMIESIDDFLARNGNKLVRADNGRGEVGHWLLPSGASLWNNGVGPSWADPPPGTEGLRARRQYHQARLKRVEGDFKTLQNALLGYGPACGWDERFYGPPKADGVAALRHLHSLVLVERDAIKALDSAIAESPEEVCKRAKEEENRLQQRLQDSKRQQLINTINSIVI